MDSGGGEGGGGNVAGVGHPDIAVTAANADNVSAIITRAGTRTVMADDIAKARQRRSTSRRPVIDDAVRALHGQPMRSLSASRVLSSPLLIALAAAVTATPMGCQSSGGAGGSSGAGGADLVITDAIVWTGQSDQADASAIAIKDGVIVAVGDSDAIAAFVTDTTEKRSLPGRFVMPGMIDGHVHPLGAGRQNAGCSLQGQKTVDAILEKVKSCHESTIAAGGFVSGRGFNLSLFPQANPHKRLLDGITGDRPSYFRGEDGHSGWANSAALKLAGISKDTPNPEHGVIERDPDGEPSGTLREDAVELVEKLIPPPTLAQDLDNLRWAMAQVSALGITSIMDAGVDERRLEAYAALADAGELHADVSACVVVNPAKPDEAVAEARKMRERFSGHPRLKVNAIKIYLDGVLEGETAALLAPYHTHPEQQGAINATQDQLNESVTKLEAAGFQVHMHVIGDAAVRAALDAYAASHAAQGDLGLRGTLAHLQLVHPDDYARFKALDVSVNAQSLWAYPDTYILDINLPQVGQERVDRMYPWGSLARAGAMVVGGSDWPVSSLNPLDAAEVMVRRQDPDAATGPVLGKDENLSKIDALRAYTSAAAVLLRDEARIGTLAVGKAADIIVLDSDILSGDASAINAAKVLLTLKDGKVVYGDAAR